MPSKKMLMNRLDENGYGQDILTPIVIIRYNRSSEEDLDKAVHNA